MEIDQQGAGCEIQDQVKVMTSEEQSGGNQSTARSYECTFCKRGFTNAQALGGHMNIHRKEKAKLKQSTSAPSLSSNKMVVVDTSKMIPTIPARLPRVVSPTTVADQGHGRSRPWKNTSLTLEETLVGEVRQLPLFVEKLLNMDQKLEIHQGLPSEVASDRKIGSSFRHDSAVSELDLELRLGPEPHNSTPSSAPTGSTRHFF